MISFIVIGKNEGWKLTKCMESVFNFIDTNFIIDCEIIYVDSRSTDDSLERVQRFTGLKIYQITGECNAAIARNIGAKESTGNIIFFIDGDMEIQADFYKAAFDENGNLKYDFTSGNWVNFNYNYKWESISISKSNFARNINDDVFEHKTGGIFIINRWLWDKVGGMRTKYKVSEDYDLALRLSKDGYPILRKKEIICKHHTIPYQDSKRIWQSLFNGSDLFPMALFRDHIFYIQAWKIFIIENYTLLFLIVVISSTLLVNISSLFIIYFGLLFFKAFNSVREISLNLFANILKLGLRDFVRFLAFFLFWPIQKETKYKQL